MMLCHRVVYAILLLFVQALLAQSSGPAIRVPVRLVTVPTLVFSSDDRFVPGLEVGNFRIFDNGQQQNITLDPSDAPVTVAIAIQVNQDVREYLPFISRAGSVFETLLLGESGEAAVLTYADEVSIVKPLNGGDLVSAFRSVRAAGRGARMLDAAWHGLTFMRQRRSSRGRFLILIGQPLDSGSETKLQALEDEAESTM